MKVYGVVGWQNAGKTTLIERLVAYYVARGLSVSTIKHVHHNVDLDQPGKDSYRHRAAGASEVALASAQRLAILREHRGPEPTLKDILARLAPVDLVLVEGYKRDQHPKLEVWRSNCAQAPLALAPHAGLRAFASDQPVLGVFGVSLDLNDTAQIAEFILQDLGVTLAGQECCTVL